MSLFGPPLYTYLSILMLHPATPQNFPCQNLKVWPNDRTELQLVTAIVTTIKQASFYCSVLFTLRPWVVCPTG